MRLEAARHAEDAAAVHAREMEHWSAQLAAERDASRDREAHVQRAADEARSALEHDSYESSCLIQATWA